MKQEKFILKSVGVFTPILTGLSIVAAARYFLFYPLWWMRGAICIVFAFAVCIFGYAIYSILKKSIEAKI
jgi:CDP-diglyceride synthetase